MSTRIKLMAISTTVARFLRNIAERQRNIWVWTEIALLAGGVTMIAIYGGSRLFRYYQSKSAIEKFTALQQESFTATDNTGEPAALPDVDFNQWDARRVDSYKESQSGQTGATLGVLEIPKVHLQAPIFDGATSLNLNRGLGWIEGTARPGGKGNVGIAGHRDGFFRALKDIAVGDSIELKTLAGTDVYVVDGIQIVPPSHVSVLRERAVPSLTLVTCYPFYYVGRAPQRYIVSASLVRSMNQASVSDFRLYAR